LRIQAAIVSRDEAETDERRKLNFGHTFGHAIESSVRLSHGEAIGIGMLIEARLSLARGLLNAIDITRIESILGFFGLPLTINGDKGPIMDAIRKDKKREGNYIHSILLEGIGRARIERIAISEIEELIDDMR
jgi:3-dehydroquinate synthase